MRRRRVDDDPSTRQPRKQRHFCCTSGKNDETTLHSTTILSLETKTCSNMPRRPLFLPFLHLLTSSYRCSPFPYDATPSRSSRLPVRSWLRSEWASVWRRRRTSRQREGEDEPGCMIVSLASIEGRSSETESACRAGSDVISVGNRGRGRGKGRQRTSPSETLICGGLFSYGTRAG